MLPNFNKTFPPSFRQETKERLRTPIERQPFSKFFPGGATERKRHFTPDELVDIYIKGNLELHNDLVGIGFGDDDFPRSKSEWERALLGTINPFYSTQMLQEKENAFAKLVGTYLDIDKRLASLGYAAFSNKEYRNKEELILYFEEFAMNYNLKLYYIFFTQIETVRQCFFNLTRFCGGGSNYAEERAACLQTIHDAKCKLKDLAKLIENNNAKARELDERTDNNG